MERVTHIPRYTYDDYKQWKDDWELIDGLPYSMSPSAIAKHQKIAGELFFQIKTRLNEDKCRDLCTPYYELDWVINENTIVRPDIAVVCGEKPVDFISLAPFLIVEILSESSSYNDRIIKKELYEQQRVRYYIIADPDMKSVEIYELVDNIFKQTKINNFTFPSGCDILLDFETIWN